MTNEYLNETFIVAVHDDGVCENTPPLRKNESIQEAMDRVDCTYLNIGNNPKAFPKVRRWLRGWRWLVQIRLRLKPTEQCPRLPCGCNENQQKLQICQVSWPSIMVNRVVWKGVWHYGHPKLLRLRIKSRYPWFYFKDMPGCGCIVYFKDQHIKLKNKIKHLYPSW